MRLSDFGRNQRGPRVIRAYEKGYKNVPESPQEIEAWEKVAIGTLSNEGWE